MHRLFERIAKTYRREQWDPLLRPLLATWYSGAQQMGDVELSVRLLFEMLGHGMALQHLSVVCEIESVLVQASRHRMTTRIRPRTTYWPS